LLLTDVDNMNTLVIIDKGMYAIKVSSSRFECDTCSTTQEYLDYSGSNFEVFTPHG